MTKRPYNRIEKRIMEHMMADKQALADTAYGKNHLAEWSIQELKAKAEKEDYNHEGTKEYFRKLYTQRVEELKKQYGYYDSIGDMHKEADAELESERRERIGQEIEGEGLTYDDHSVPFEKSWFAKTYLTEEAEEDPADFHGDFNSLDAEAKDQIINPKHYKMIPKEAYTRFPEGLEYMDLMEYILSSHAGVESHLLGQIFKYACRIGKKDSKLQDASKIEWYANRLVRVIEGK